MRIETDFYTLNPSKTVLLITARLSWDERVVANLLKDVEAIISTFYRDRNWALVSDGRDWELTTLQAAMLIQNFSDSNATAGLTNHAIVVGESKIKQWVLEEKMIGKDKAFNSKIFSSMEDAQAWLEPHGYILKTV